MDPSSLPKLSTLLASGHGAAFALDPGEWSFGVVAGGNSVTFDARFTGKSYLRLERHSILKLRHLVPNEARKMQGIGCSIRNVRCRSKTFKHENELV